MRRSRLFLIVGLVALAVPLFGASGAQADVGACAFTGAAGPLQADDPNDGGVESILNDLGNLDLLDHDTGSYSFDNAGAPLPSACLLVDDVNEPDGDNDTGLFSVHISSEGRYDNIVCGTGTATDRGAIDVTSGDLTAIASAGDGLGEDIADTNYTIQFVAGTGPIVISSAVNQSGETALGGGVVNIAPTTGNCVTEDVSVFQASGAFALVGTN